MLIHVALVGKPVLDLRGRLFETLPQGGMLSVQLPADETRTFMGPELSLAAINGPALSILSGPVAAVAEAEASLRLRGIECARVHIRIAAHSAMVDPILGEFERFCRTIEEEPRCPVRGRQRIYWFSLHCITYLAGMIPAAFAQDSWPTRNAGANLAQSMQI